MKCHKCGSDLSDDTKFCSYCGTKIEEDSQMPPIPKGDEEINTEATKKENLDNEREYANIPPKISFVDKAKENFLIFWNNLDLFCKIGIIVGIIVAILLVTSILNSYIIPIIISLLQVGGLVVAFLMHKKRIKSPRDWVKYLLLALIIIFVFVNISSYSWFDGFDINNQILNNFIKVNTPYGSENCVGKDKDTVKLDFQASGFSNITEEAMGDLEITETDTYEKVESISINGVEEFEGDKQFKASSKIVIKYHSYKCKEVPLSCKDAKSMEVEAVLKAFEDAGFVNVKTDEIYDLNPDDTQVEFENRVSIDGVDSFERDAKFPLNADIIIATHKPYKVFNLKVIVDFVPNLIFSKYDVKLEIDGIAEKLTHGHDATFEYRLKQGKYTILFKSAESSSVKGSAEIDLTGDTEVSYKIYCYSDKVGVETLYLENKGAVGVNESMVPSSASNCKFKNYKDIDKMFKNAGFTNITTEILYDIILGWTDEGEVDKVSINGKTDFQRGDVFAKDADIVITYHMKEEDNPNKAPESGTSNPEVTVTGDTEKPGPVFYSTNDYETAKKGNSGEFSYKNKSGSYDIYWIINFDEGYAYWFTEGNGDDTCDRVKIVSGDLNDKITVTWHDGTDQWSWKLHFKYVNHPETLVVNDQNGFPTEFTTTDLDDALALRKNKTIKDY